MVSGQGNGMGNGEEMGQHGVFWARGGTQQGGTEYKCWEEQERGSDRQGLMCQARRLALTEEATGSPCRCLAGE